MDKVQQIDFKSKIFGRIEEVESLLKAIETPELADAAACRLAKTTRLMAEKKKDVEKKSKSIYNRT